MVGKKAKSKKKSVRTAPATEPLLCITKVHPRYHDNCFIITRSARTARGLRNHGNTRHKVLCTRRKKKRTWSGYKKKHSGFNERPRSPDMSPRETGKQQRRTGPPKQREHAYHARSERVESSWWVRRPKATKKKRTYRASNRATVMHYEGTPEVQ